MIYKLTLLLIFCFGLVDISRSQSPKPSHQPVLLVPEFSSSDRWRYVFNASTDAVVILLPFDHALYKVQGVEYKGYGQQVALTRRFVGEVLEVVRQAYSVTSSSDLEVVIDPPSSIPAIRLPRNGRRIRINGKLYRARGQVVKIR